MKWLKRIGIVLAVLLIVPAVTLWAMGHRNGAGTMQASAEINASPQQIWGWLEDGDRLKQWVSWLVDVKYPDGPMSRGVGVTRLWTMRDENNGGELMQIVGKCSEYVPNARMTMQLSSPEGMFDGEQAYTLTNLGNGRTRMSIDSRFQFHQWFANLMEPLITPQAKKKMESDVNRLKTLVEAQAKQ